MKQTFVIIALFWAFLVSLVLDPTVCALLVGGWLTAATVVAHRARQLSMQSRYLSRRITRAETERVRAAREIYNPVREIYAKAGVPMAEDYPYDPKAYRPQTTPVVPARNFAEYIAGHARQMASAVLGVPLVRVAPAPCTKGGPCLARHRETTVDATGQRVGSLCTECGRERYWLPYIEGRTAR